MSARLTLLLLCDEPELHSPFISALLAAGFRLLIEHYPEDAKTLLSRVPADAVMIRHHAVRCGSRVGASGAQCPGPQPGIDSVCHADPKDEIVARAVAVFFHSALTKQSSQRPVHAANENVPAAAAHSKTQLTL